MFAKPQSRRPFTPSFEGPFFLSPISVRALTRVPAPSSTPLPFLSFQSLTSIKFCNSFVLIFIQIGRGVPVVHQDVIPFQGEDLEEMSSDVHRSAERTRVWGTRKQVVHPDRLPGACRRLALCPPINFSCSVRIKCVPIGNNVLKPHMYPLLHSRSSVLSCSSRLQICPFVFNYFHDALSTTPFFSNPCIVAPGMHPIPTGFVSTFDFRLSTFSHLLASLHPYLVTSILFL